MVDEGDPQIDEKDYLADVDEAYWMDNYAEQDEDAFGHQCFISYQVEDALAAEKRKAMTEQENRIVKAKMMPTNLTNPVKKVPAIPSQ